MAEPIVDHELQLGGQKQIDLSCWDEVGARQQLTTNDAWIGLIKAWWLFAKGLRQRRVASKPCIRHSHPSFDKSLKAPSAVRKWRMSKLPGTGGSSGAVSVSNRLRHRKSTRSANRLITARGNGSRYHTRERLMNR